MDTLQGYGLPHWQEFLAAWKWCVFGILLCAWAIEMNKGNM